MNSNYFIETTLIGEREMSLILNLEKLSFEETFTSICSAGQSMEKTYSIDH